MNQFENMNDWVAIIEASGSQRVERFKLSPEKVITIGRAWNSDIVLEDQYVDPKHLAIELDDSNNLSIRDLKTINGSRLGKLSIKDKIEYQQGTSIRLGDTRIRFYRSDTQVPKALPFDSVHQFTRSFKSTGAIIICSVLFFGAMLAAQYFDGVKESNAENVLTDLFGLGVLSLAWCLIAGFVGKLFRHETNFAQHWVFICLLGLLSIFILRFSELIEFNFSGSILSTLLSFVFTAGLIGILVFGTLSLATRLGKPKKLFLACLFAITPYVLTLVTPLLKEERELWSYRAEPGISTKNPALKWRKSVSYNQHSEAVDDLFDKLDEKVKGNASLKN